MATIRENNGDASADTGTRYTLVLGDVFLGTLDPAADKDWIKVKLTAGTIYDITLTGVESSRLKLLGSAGNDIVSGGVITSGAKLIFSPSVSGTYYIHIASNESTYSGEYELSLAENTIPEGTYDEVADYLTHGYWEEEGASSRAFNVEPGGVLTANITDLTEDGQQLARWALYAWTDVTGIKFELVDDDDAHISFDDNEDRGFANSTVVDNVIISSRVNISADWLVEHGNTIGSFTFRAYIHEIGHALGLGHPGPYNFDEYDDPIYYGLANIFLNDSVQATGMSYFSQDENTYIDANYAYPVTPMVADIIAIHNLYGVPDSVNTGDTVYGYQSNLDGYLGEFSRLWTGEANPFSSIDMTDDAGTPVIKSRLVDLDSDGDLDLVVGNNTGLLHYFENTGTSSNPGFTERTGTANPLDGMDAGSYSAPTFTDLDSDGDYDLIVGNYNGDIAYFENTGTATNPGFTQRNGANNPLDDIKSGSFNTLTLTDLDGDSDLDLVVGDDDGAIHYYENIGTSANSNFVLRAGEANPFNDLEAGSHSTPVFVDFDGDNDPDLVVGNDTGLLHYFENTGTSSRPGFTERTGTANPLAGIDTGSYSTPTFGDLNGDGSPDLIVGNLDGVIHYFKNTGIHADPEFSPQSLLHPTTLTIYDNSGNDTLDLRTDKDDQRVDLRPEGISDVYGLTGNLVIARHTIIENFIAGSGNDRVAGNAVVNYLNGNDGNDRIWGRGGDDILEGGAGADRLDGGTGMDWASYQGSDAAVRVNLADGTVTGGHAEGDVLTNIENVIGSDYEDTLVGNDDANRLAGRAGADHLDGGGGEDWVSYLESDTGVTVNLSDNTVAGGYAEGDVIVNFENVTGSGHDDVLTGDAGANQLDGDRGDDLLEGRSGADRLVGGAGEDIASYEHSNAGVTVHLHSILTQDGDAEGDTFGALLRVGYTDSEGVTREETVPDIEHLRGSGYADVLAGDSRANRLEGGAGDDRLYGGPTGGDDVLRGGPGADALYGGIGDDVLEGGQDADTLRGGSGADTASYEHSDAAVVVHLSDGTVQGGHAEGDALADIENITGSAYDDVLTGDEGANVLEGGAGADQLDGGAGVDWVSYQGSDERVIIRLIEGTGEGGDAEGDVLVNFENVNGSDYTDGLVGDNRANYLAGNGGYDGLWGYAGDDILEGGADADRLFGGAGVDTASYQSSDDGVSVNLKEGTSEGGHANGDVITDIENITGSIYKDVLVGDDGANRLDGNEGDDELKGGVGNDQLYGNPGHDWLYGGNGDDELQGNEGNDRLFGENGVDSLYGGDDDDELNGGENNDQLYGEMGEDILYGDEGDDELNGGDGNDWLFGEIGADQMDGGSGIDWVSYQESGVGITVDLTEGTGEGGHAQGDVINNVENLVGSDYADVLIGDSVANILQGLNGDDEIRGNGGNDVLEGGAGADRLNGGAGVDAVSYRASDEGVTVDLAEGAGEGGHAEGDVLTSIENVIGSDHEDTITGDSNANHLEGGNGDDELIGSDGADRLNGGNGEDRVEYWSSDTGVTVNLEEGTGEGGDAEGDVIIGVENVQGSYYRDVLIGDNGSNYLDGLDGNDELRGNDGQDWLNGREGADKLDGGDGSDWVSYWASEAGVTVNLEDGTSEGGHAEGDVLVNVENIRGSDYKDILSGDEDVNILRGHDGDDELRGNNGDDRLYGNVGDDRLDGGGGADRLYGNEGNDIFIFEAGHGDDRILDFTDGEDQIDLSAFSLSGFDDLTITSISDSVKIDLSEHGGGTILLQDFDMVDLDSSDFLF